MNVWKELKGLDCCKSSGFNSGVKCVDGLVRGKTCNDGGGIPEGKLGYMNGTAVAAFEVSDCGGLRGLGAGFPPAAKTAGGIACIKVSR